LLCFNCGVERQWFRECREAVAVSTSAQR